MVDADYDWLETHLPSVATQMTLPEQREVLRVIEGAQAAAWDDALAAALLVDFEYETPPNPYRATTSPDSGPDV